MCDLQAGTAATFGYAKQKAVRPMPGNGDGVEIGDVWPQPVGRQMFPQIDNCGRCDVAVLSDTARGGVPRGMGWRTRVGSREPPTQRWIGVVRYHRRLGFDNRRSAVDVNHFLTFVRRIETRGSDAAGAGLQCLRSLDGAIGSGSVIIGSSCPRGFHKGGGRTMPLPGSEGATPLGRHLV